MIQKGQQQQSELVHTTSVTSARSNGSKAKRGNSEMDDTSVKSGSSKGKRKEVQELEKAQSKSGSVTISVGSKNSQRGQDSNLKTKLSKSISSADSCHGQKEKQRELESKMSRSSSVASRTSGSSRQRKSPRQHDVFVDGLTSALSQGDSSVSTTSTTSLALLYSNFAAGLTKDRVITSSRTAPSTPYQRTAERNDKEIKLTSALSDSWFS